MFIWFCLIWAILRIIDLITTFILVVYSKNTRDEATRIGYIISEFVVMNIPFISINMIKLLITIAFLVL